MIGDSLAFRNIVTMIDRVARYDVPALIYGETGTGKELAAREIHYRGPRRDKPFVPVNCGAIPDTLVESELFGHDRGAFTDAHQRRHGLIACARGGTLFLDEVDALTPKGQVTLLRFLQDQQYRPVGSDRQERADVRIIAATNADLSQLCTRGRFRIDLWYRLRVFEMSMPPLRERHGDCVLLAQHFVQELCHRHHVSQKMLADDTLAWFERYAWPGNVRELENLVYRAFLLADGAQIRIAEPASCGDSVGRDPVTMTLSRGKALVIQQFEQRYLKAVLERARGNLTLAAQLAGKERRALGKLVKKHGIDRKTFIASS